MTREQAINYLICRGFTNEQVGEVVRALTYEPTTKNDLGVDCIDRKAIEKHIEDGLNSGKYGHDAVNIMTEIHFMPSVTPRLCDTCRHYENRCHWLPSVTPQEPFKSMVEIDLYSVIKQKYIEREVLDKIRAEIETKYGQCDICEYFDDYDYEENDISEYRPIGNIADILQIIDKYKAESEA